jgi:hypothetical protein
MSFLTIRSLSARPRRRLVLGRDGELGPISPNRFARANDGTSGGKHVKFGVPRGGAVKEKFCEETPLETDEVVDPRYTIALPMMYFQ